MTDFVGGRERLDGIRRRAGLARRIPAPLDQNARSTFQLWWYVVCKIVKYCNIGSGIVYDVSVTVTWQ